MPPAAPLLPEDLPEFRSLPSASSILMSGEASSKSQKVDQSLGSNDVGSCSPDPVYGLSCSPCRTPSPPSNSKKASEKLPKHKKKLHLASKDDTSLISDLWPSSGVHPSWLSSPKLKRISDATSASSSAMTTPSHIMPKETKSSDFNVCNCQDTSSNTEADSSDNYSTASTRRHTGDDFRWEAILMVNSGGSPISFRNFKLIKRIGYGDIGCVYLAVLKGTSISFAIKVMEKASLVSRNKLLRAQTEREILNLLDHPFLPSLYSHFETEKFYCLVMEYCSGGNLHSLRQKEPNKHFTEKSARFYASEVLLAIEYLHMLGIVYRDLKPENVLVRDDGHIMLSDFDLSLQCSFNPTLVQTSFSQVGNSGSHTEGKPGSENLMRGCIHPTAFFPRILPKKNHRSKSDFGLGSRNLVELMAEPTDVRSMSFVGTHEYLAPEIIRGEGHGSAVDWWTFGIFLFELVYGTTPFKGSGNRATLFNIVGQPLMFPDTPSVSLTARDLIRGLLEKEPEKRIGYRRGSAEIKQQPFFEGVNWALVRCSTPPYVPDPVDMGQFSRKDVVDTTKKVSSNGANGNCSGNSSSDPSYINFEFF